MTIKLFKTILDIQAINPQLMLCGSAALIYANLLPKREIGDLDFAINKRDLTLIQGVYNLKEDRYPENIHDRYTSYHGSWSFLGLFSKYSINLLVFEDDILLNSETIIYDGEHIKIQKVDDILHWKEKYNRTKDINDLNNITTKAIEETLLN